MTTQHVTFLLANRITLQKGINGAEKHKIQKLIGVCTTQDNQNLSTKIALNSNIQGQIESERVPSKS